MTPTTSVSRFLGSTGKAIATKVSVRSGEPTPTPTSLRSGTGFRDKSTDQGKDSSTGAELVGKGHGHVEAAVEARVIVGVDFGTTHSAVAWALTSSPGEYEVITTWPGQVGKDWGKVPSDISYTVVGQSESSAVGSAANDQGADSAPVGNLEYKWYWFFDICRRMEIL